jgi:hypothetical protein
MNVFAGQKIIQWHCGILTVTIEPYIMNEHHPRRRFRTLKSNQPRLKTLVISEAHRFFHNCTIDNHDQLLLVVV